MCVGLLFDPKDRYDVHVRVGRTIQSMLVELNVGFKLRIGVGEGSDCVYQDVNKNTNFAGHGINSAARAMTAAKPNGIAVTQQTFDRLSQHSEYIDSLERIDVKINGTNWTFYDLHPVECSERFPCRGQGAAKSKSPGRFRPKASRRL